MAGKSRASVGGGGIQWNRRVVLITSVAGLTVLYLIFSYMSKPATNNFAPVKKFATWKTGEFVDIPSDIVEKAKAVKIDERNLSFEFDGKVMTVYLKEVHSSTTADSIDVLLLHGSKFNSQVWVDVGTLQLLAAMKFHVIAVDLPGTVPLNIGVFFTEVNANSKTGVPILLLHGAGSSSEIWSKLGTMKILGALGTRAIALDLPGSAKSSASALEPSEDVEPRFLAQFIKQENLDRPVIVSPSMSGRYSIPYLMKPKPATCDERARAFVPLAPVHTQKFTHAEYHRCEIPVLIVYGSKDVNLGLTSVGNLRNMPNREIIEMEGAGHANYEERPDEWNKLLYNFMLAVKKEQL